MYVQFDVDPLVRVNVTRRFRPAHTYSPCMSISTVTYLVSKELEWVRRAGSEIVILCQIDTMNTMSVDLLEPPLTHVCTHCMGAKESQECKEIYRKKLELTSFSGLHCDGLQNII